METCVRLARQHSVRLGAHPGPWSRNDFGRGPARFAPDAFELLLLHQVGALERVARANGVRLHHIKLHGALYHASDENEALAKRYVATVRRFWPPDVPRTATPINAKRPGFPPRPLHRNLERHQHEHRSTRHRRA